MNKLYGLAGVLVLIVATQLSGQTEKPKPTAKTAAKTTHAFQDLGLTVDYAALGSLTPILDTSSWNPASWVGTVDGHSVHVWLIQYARKKYSVDEPGDVLGVYVYNRRSEKDKRSRWLMRDRRLLPGKFGFVPYAILGTCPLRDGGKAGRCFLLCGVSKAHGYAVAVECYPAPSKSVADRIRRFLTNGVRYAGELREPFWTDADARAYWKRHADAKIHDQLRIHRTEHFIILTNADSKLFAGKMEGYYAKIRSTFPFAEVPGRRPLPVLVFRRFWQYVDFYSRRAKISRAAAGQTVGHAWHDYYATSYRSPEDPVHLHEATHQIFMNRLLLGGGGSWFHEGVADFMCEKPDEIRQYVKRMIRAGEHVPFKRFMLIPMLAESRLGGGEVGDGATANYRQAASIFLFLSESEFGRKGFQKFVRTMGRLAERDLKGMEQATREIYGVGIDELESRWKGHYR